MIIVRLPPVFLSFLFLGAHFFRGSNYAFAALALISPLLLIIRSRWAEAYFFDYSVLRVLFATGLAVLFGVLVVALHSVFLAVARI